MAALLIAFAGLYIAVSYGSSQFLDGYGILPIAAVVIVALANAVATVLVKRYTYDMQSSVLIFNLANLLFFGALFFIEGGAFGAFGTGTIIAAVYVGLFYNVITGFLYYRSLRALKTTLVTNIYFISPFLTFLAAGIILGEPVEAYYIIVALMVAVGIIIQRFDKKGGTYAQRKKPLLGGFAIYDVTPAYSNTENETVHNYVKGSGRALAVKVPALHASKVGKFLLDNREEAAQYGAMMYSDADYQFHGAGEMEHVRSIVGAGDGDSVIICAGKPEHGELFLGRTGPEIYGFGKSVDLGSG